MIEKILPIQGKTKLSNMQKDWERIRLGSLFFVIALANKITFTKKVDIISAAIYRLV
jgi:hypothetical protein